MDFWRKILLLAIIVLFTYILYRLLLKRSAILQKQRIEHFTPLMSGPSISSINMNSLTKSNGITDPSTAKQLKQFFIKASYHTAYNGTDLSSSMIKYALNRGYRWLDFCTSDGTNVNYTTDDTFKEVQTTATSVAFPEIFTQIFTHGFISPDSPNPRDPIFVQIRPLFSSDKSNNAMIMTQIKGILDGLSSSYSTRVFSDRITKTTTIDQLLGKVVIVMDTNNNTIDEARYEQLMRTLTILTTYVLPNPEITNIIMIGHHPILGLKKLKKEDEEGEKQKKKKEKAKPFLISPRRGAWGWKPPKN